MQRVQAAPPRLADKDGAGTSHMFTDSISVPANICNC